MTSSHSKVPHRIRLKCLQVFFDVHIDAGGVATAKVRPQLIYESNNVDGGNQENGVRKDSLFEGVRNLEEFEGNTFELFRSFLTKEKGEEGDAEAEGKGKGRREKGMRREKGKGKSAARPSVPSRNGMGFWFGESCDSRIHRYLVVGATASKRAAQRNTRFILS